MPTGLKVNAELELVTVDCGGCGMMFAVPSGFDETMRRTGRDFRCPNVGCSWPTMSYNAKDKMGRLEEEARRAKRRAEMEADMRRAAESRADREERRARAYKGHLNRTKKRVAAGVCPCCRRSFDNLKRHMETKHPNYAPPDTAASS